MSIAIDLFDIDAQINVLNGMVKDDEMCAKMVKYLGIPHEHLKKVSIFSQVELQNIFDTLCEFFIEKSSRPSTLELKQKIHSNYSKDEKIRDRTKQLFEKIIEKEFEKTEFIIQDLQDKIKLLKTFQVQQCTDALIKKHGANASSILRKLNEEITTIDFSTKKEYTLSDTFDMLDEQDNSPGFLITTGDKRLDKAVNGGIPRGSLVVLPAGTNSGKSMYCVSWCGKVLDQIDPLTGKNLGLRVLYIPLEGYLSEMNIRFLSNRTKVKMKDIQLREYDSDPKKNKEKEAEMREIAKEYDERLKILPMMDFKVTIDDLIAQLEETYKEFPFDFLCVDYGQLLKTTIRQEKRHEIAEVFQGLSAAATKFDCVVASPVQGTREAQKLQYDDSKKNGDRLPVVRLEHISESFDVARVAAYVFTLNTSDEEQQRNEYRVFVDKSRSGEKGQVFGSIVDFPRANLHTGQFFDTKSGMRDMSHVSEELENQEESNVEEITQLTDSKDLIEKNIVLDDKKSEIEEVIKKINTLQKELDDEAADNPFDTDGEQEEKLAKLRKLGDKKLELETSYMNLFRSTYPNAKASDIEEYQSTFESKKGKRKYEEECLEIQNILDRYELAIKIDLK